MRSRNIVFPERGRAELIEEEIQEIRAGEVLVHLAVSTTSSGTERANLLGSDTVDWTAPPKEAVFPKHLGYCSSGTVVSVGEGVTEFRPGDRVACAFGQYREYCRFQTKNLIHIGDLPFEEAATFFISVFPMAAIRKCRLELGESAVVMGQGILGQFAVVLLKAAGAVPVVAVDPMPEKRARALELGADYAFDPYEPDFGKKVKEATGGGANVGIEVTGIGAGLDGILDCMALKGRVALLGCTRSSDFTIDYYRKVHGPGITLIGAHTNARPTTESSPGWWTQRDDMLAVKRLTEYGRLSLASLVEETSSPEQAPEIFQRLAVERSFPIHQFDWRLLK
ncbi:MAG: zinc-binding dehydrogenase [Clostridia bacterium]|nr:zinc-binding dehydrogenase [Clostridia bacterium]